MHECCVFFNYISSVKTRGNENCWMGQSGRGLMEEQRNGSVLDRRICEFSRFSIVYRCIHSFICTVLYCTGRRSGWTKIEVDLTFIQCSAIISLPHTGVPQDDPMCAAVNMVSFPYTFSYISSSCVLPNFEKEINVPQVGKSCWTLL